MGGKRTVRTQNFLEQSEKEVVILHKTEKRSAKDAENVKWFTKFAEKKGHFGT